MAGFANELSTLCAEIHSDKLPARNKAAERLNNILINENHELMVLFNSSRADRQFDVTWTAIFNAVIGAAIKHAAKLQDLQDTKAKQRMADKNIVFKSLTNKLINYSLQGNSTFSSKASIFNAFVEGIQIPSTVKYFGSMFLELLDKGIYKSLTFKRELKVNEFSRILSYLFEVDVANDEQLRFAILATMTTTVELATEYVQIGADLVEYLPEVMVFASKANDDRKKADVIKLFYLFVNELDVDYHLALCTELQSLLPLLSGFYDFHMKTEIKEKLFNGVYLSLLAIYPQIYTGNLCTINVALKESWPNTLQKLKSMVDKEMRERNTNLRLRAAQVANDKSLENFVKMAALTIYILNWNTDRESTEEFESRCKIAKVADKLEDILKLVHPKKTEFNEIWLAILAELLSIEGIINATNIKPALEICLNVLMLLSKIGSMRTLRLCLSRILNQESMLITNNFIPHNYNKELWTKIIDELLLDSSPSAERIPEQQLLLQSLITHKRLEPQHCTTVLNSFVSNAALKRTECLQTIRQMLIHSEDCGFDKSSEAIGRIIKWLYKPSEGINVALLNVAPIPPALVADTCAIAVINFLNEKQNVEVASELPSLEGTQKLRLLRYKYNRKLVCLEQHGHESQHLKELQREYVGSESNNCLFQNNYELLMREMNIETSKGALANDILGDLQHFHKMACLMKSLLEYRVFIADNFMQCPLIKRTGFYLTHLEFQLKSSSANNFGRSHLFDILQSLISCFSVLTSQEVLLCYLERQPLDESIGFLGNCLKYSGSQKSGMDFEDWPSVTTSCLKVLAILCASSTHCADSFHHISSYRLNLRTQLSVLMDLVEIFCGQKNLAENIASWFVEYLKSALKVYYTNVEFASKFVELMPAIFIYVQHFPDHLDDMFIALISFVRLAYKKSYNTRFTAKLIASIRRISQNCNSFCGDENFTNICVSTAKFLSSSSLEIQFATINTLTALMDINWFSNPEAAPQVYFDFCQQLFAQIDWKSLPANTADMAQNSSAGTVQMLTSLFVFSSHHKEIALQELMEFCMLRTLTAADVPAFNDVPRYLECSLEVLTKPYMHHLILAWKSKHYPISAFPYFICCNSKDSFIAANLPWIVTSVLMFEKEFDDFKEFSKYGQPKQILKAALPISRALLLPYQARCAEAADHNCEIQVKALVAHFKTFGSDLLNAEDVSCICYVANLLKDVEKFNQLLGLEVVYQPPKWYEISYSSLKKCLAYYIGKAADPRQVHKNFASILTDCPLNLVKAFCTLKENVFSCLFTFDRLHGFYIYCCVAEFVVDAMALVNHGSASVRNKCQYIMRDIIFFVLHHLEMAKQVELQKASLTFLSDMLKKPALAMAFCKDVIRTYLNDICKTLVATIERSDAPEIDGMCLSILNQFVNNQKDELGDAIAMLDEFPMSDKFADLREVQLSMQSQGGENDVSAIIKSFLQTRNRGIEGIRAARSNIAKMKSQLQLEGELFYDLIKRLLELARNSDNQEFGLEAVKCLGEIGSLKIEGIAYYFQTDAAIYENESASDSPMHYFITSMLGVVEQLLLNFQAKTHHTVCEVAQVLVNAIHAKNLIAAFPYFHVFKSHDPKTQNYLDVYISLKPLDWLGILRSENISIDYDGWICGFVGKIFEFCGWTAFQQLALQNSSFAEAALQPFIKLLMPTLDEHLPGLVEMLDFFFESSEKAIITSSRGIFNDKKIVSKFLSISECIRTNNNWRLPLKLQIAAKACNYCQAHFMAVMYLEMWAADQAAKEKPKTNAEIMADKEFQKSAIKAYQSIGCSDAISGLVNPLTSPLLFHSLENNLFDVLLLAKRADGDDDGKKLYTSVMQRNALFDSMCKSNKSVHYEVCWRLADWKTPVEGSSKLNTLNDMELEFEKQHFNALKFLSNREENNSLAAVSNARHCVLSILKEISIECLQNVYKYLTWLNLLQQTEDFCHIQFSSRSAPDTRNISEIFGKWQTDLELKYGSFSCKEKVLSHQNALFSTAGVRANRKITEFYKENPIQTNLLRCITECKNAGEMNFAKRQINVLRSMNITNKPIEASALLEEAVVSYKTDIPQMTRAILQHLLKCNDFGYCPQRVDALRVYGEYLIDSNTENFDTVLQKYFKGSMTAFEHFKKNKDAILKQHPNIFEMESFEAFETRSKRNAFETIAKYADREYTQLNSYANSDEFELKCKIIQSNREAANSVSNHKDREKAVGANLMKKQANLDEKEVQTVQAALTNNLCIAVEHYIKFCTVDEQQSSAAIYRIIALWFANKQNDDLHAKIEEHISSVPTYKFICALNQMTARLNSDNPKFIAVLKELLIGCTKDHPHQTLYQLYSLVFAFSDSAPTEINNRVKIAKEIIEKARNASNSECMKQLELMFPALIEFANQTLNDKLDLSDKMKRLKNLNALQCPTIDLPVNAAKQYNLISIVKWQPQASLVGGINAPKRMKCLCSNGKTYTQLLKGKDDLRQDAVMQQVFNMINDLLRHDPAAVQRKLLLRTYKIVPLSMRSGILEWCENTTPFGVYLAGDGKGGAHNKYRPEDFTIKRCRTLAMSVLKTNFAKRLEVFLHLCQNIKPVFQYFFFENFLEPGIWFERRLAYMNSVATTSIVGYILGLGDRHTQNILIDQKTAEVVHIDFGIAFEQGKIMPTPETVPFRLTRDIVAPMGISETNGVFKKSCEATMRVLRNHHAVITTILEVLLYDPLYIWKVVPQSSTSRDEKKNSTAQRALLRVQNKLLGNQVGIIGSSSVEVQVQRLINEAISLQNLSQLYPGWDPYL